MPKSTEQLSPNIRMLVGLEIDRFADIFSVIIVENAAPETDVFPTFRRNDFPRTFKTN